MRQGKDRCRAAEERATGKGPGRWGGGTVRMARGGVRNSLEKSDGAGGEG